MTKAATIVRVTNVTKSRVLAVRAKIARTFGARFLGLMGRRHLPLGDGLIIIPCSGVHTFFMRIPIDVLFLDANDTVCRAVSALPPWHATPLVQGARSVVELPAGTTLGSGTEVGDKVVMTPADTGLVEDT